MARLFSLLLLVVLWCVPASAEQPPWTEIRSPHFRVLTDGTPAEAQQVAAQLEEFRFVLRWRFPGYRVDLDSPFTVFAVRNFETALRFLPAWKAQNNVLYRDSDGDLIDYSRQSFFPNWERTVALVRLDDWQKTSHDRLFAGFTHEMLVQNQTECPRWLDHGLSDLLGYTHFNGNDLIVGSPVPGWATLKSRTMLPIRELLEAGPGKGFQTSDVLQQQLINDESWGLVHFLSFSPGMESGGRLLRLLHLLNTPEYADKPVAAFQAVFGDPSQLDAPFQAYIHGKALTAVVAPSFASLPPAAFQTKLLTPAQALAEEGVFATELQYLDHGQALLQQALQLDPTNALAHETLGALAFDDGKIKEARQHWQSALAQDPDRVASAFGLVMTGVPYHLQTAAQREATLTELRRIVHVQPLYAPAYTQVAIVLWWQGKLDIALRSAQEAVRLAPQRGGYRLLLARLFLAAQQPARAATLLLTFAKESSYESIFATRQLNQTHTAPPRPEQLASDLVAASGHLVSMSCGNWYLSAPKHVTVHLDGSPSDATLFLTAGDHARIGIADSVWVGGGHNFDCHVAQGRPVEVVFRPGAKGFGELLHFSVMDDLPPLDPPAAPSAPPTAALSGKG